MAEASPLDYAIQLERDGQAFYDEAAANTKSRLGAKMYEGLAADERRHEQVLRALADEMDIELGDATPKQRIVTLFAQLGPVMQAELGAEPDDSEVIGKAIGLERKAAAFYAEQADAAEAPRDQALYERLAAEERQHVEILESTLTYLNDTGHWFLWGEQAMLDGG